MKNIGTLFLISTPIGNLGDITYRGIDTLKNVTLILAEDTRRSSKLLSKYDITTPMLSYNEHNRDRRIPIAVAKLIEDEDIALVTDAGTPSISDPGYRLVRKCISQGIIMVSVPGASAVLSSLVPSGLPPDRFIFEGFLPKKKGRTKRLASLKNEERTIIFFESPERLRKTLQDLKDILGNRPTVICRELTKIHEEIWRGDLDQAISVFSSKKVKGEITLLIGKNSDNVYFKQIHNK